MCVYVCNLYLLTMNAVEREKRSRPLPCLRPVWIILTLLAAAVDASADGCDWTGRLIFHPHSIQLDLQLGSRRRRSKNPSDPLRIWVVEGGGGGGGGRGDSTCHCPPLPILRIPGG